MDSKISKVACTSAIAILMAAGLLLAGTTAVDPGAAERRTHHTSTPVIPEKLEFCGEEVPLTRADVRESLEREIIANTYQHSATLLNIKRSGRYFPFIERTLKEMGVPDDLKYLAVAESNLIPTISSPAGARGMWQFMNGTAKDYKLKVTAEIDERLDIEKSTRAACAKLRSDYNRLGSWTLAAAAYNGGLSNAQKRKETQHQESYYDILWVDETSRYVFRILALKVIMNSPANYGFEVSDDEMYKPYDTRPVKLPTPQRDLAQWAIDNGATYKQLRTLNPWISKPQLTEPQDTLTVLLPN